MPTPYSDNLYSTNEEEDESALSPTDGYFHASSSSDVASASHHNTTTTTTTRSSSRLHVPVVPNVMVEDPTVREVQDAADKAREAEWERGINTSGSYYETRAGGAAAASADSSRTTAHHHRRSIDEEQSSTTYSSQTQQQQQQQQSSITHHGEAPPAYSPSSPTQQTTSTSYHTFGPAGLPLPNTMGVPAEQQGLLSRDPQSMGDGAPNRHTESWRERLRDAWQFGHLRKWTTRVLGILVILAIFLAILGAFDGGKSDHWNKTPGNGVKDPAKVPSSPDGDDMDPSFPNKCYNRPYRFAKIGSEVEFNPEQSLTIIQKPEEEREHLPFRPRVHVTGEVIVRPVKSSSLGKIEFEVIANSKDLNVQIDFDEALQKAVIISPTRVEWDASEMAPCIQIRVTVWVPQGATIKGLDFSVTHLDVEFFQGLSLAAGDGASISTVVGDLVAPTLEDEKDVNRVEFRPYLLDSRDIHLKSVSGDIKGWYPLYDTLKITTGSGEIDVVAGPQPVNKDNPKPASLEVSSISGTVKVREPVDAALVSENPEGFPPRDFSVGVQTVSSDIIAVLAFTSLADFKSVSGDLNLRLWPILDYDKTYSGSKSSSGPQLNTDSKSGETRLDLREPRYIVTDASSSFSSLQSASSSSASPHPLTLFSKHSSTSGDIHLTYPSAWEGKLRAQTLSGSQHFAGKGLEVTRKGGSYLSLLEGKKGENGKSYMSVESISGKEEFIVGDE